MSGLRYFAGNRTALWGRSTSNVIWQTTPGSGGTTRFNSEFCNGCLQVSAGDGFTVPVSMDGTTASHLFVKWDQHNSNVTAGNNAPPYIQFRDNTLNVIARIVGSGTVSPLCNVQYWNGTSWTNVGAQFSNVAALETRQVEIITGASGTIRVWQGDVPIFEATGIPFNRTGPVRDVVFTNGTNAGIGYYSRIVMASFDLRGFNLRFHDLTTNGAFNDATGTLADLSDANPATLRSLATAGSRFSADHADITLPSGTSIAAVTLAGVVRGASPAPNLRFILENGGDQADLGADVASPGPGYAWRGQTFLNHPTQGPWTAATYNATNKGIQARA